MPIDLTNDMPKIEAIRKLAVDKPVNYAIYQYYNRNGFPRGWTDPYSTYLLDETYRVTLTEEHVRPDLPILHLSISNRDFSLIDPETVRQIAQAFGFSQCRVRTVDLGGNRQQIHVGEPTNGNWREFDKLFSGIYVRNR